MWALVGCLGGVFGGVAGVPGVLGPRIVPGMSAIAIVVALILILIALRLLGLL